MRSHVRLALLTATSLLAAVALIGPATASAQTTSGCPTFSVLHNDQIGRMSLPMGSYTVTPTGLTCAEASDLFRQFLEAWDGRLPRPWVANAATRTFTRGSGGSVGFSVAPTSTPSGGGGGGHHPHGTACPGTFQVLHNDRIGTFQIPEGSYQITLLSVGRISCSQAASYLARFLQDFDGILPRPWVLDPETGSFMRGSRNVGFRIKKALGPPNPNGGGGGTHPTGDRCRGTFRVLHNDQIGRLSLPRGRYRITVLPDGPSCARASSLFTNFLELFMGNLPSPWRMNVQTASFTRGRSSGTGFRVKPVR